MVFNEIGRFEFIYGLYMVYLEDLDPGFVHFLLQIVNEYSFSKWQILYSILICIVVLLCARVSYMSHIR